MSASARARAARSASAYASANTWLPELRRRSSHEVAEAGAEVPSTWIDAMIMGSMPMMAGVPITASSWRVAHPERGGVAREGRGVDEAGGRRPDGERHEHRERDRCRRAACPRRPVRSGRLIDSACAERGDCGERDRDARPAHARAIRRSGVTGTAGRLGSARPTCHEFRPPRPWAGCARSLAVGHGCCVILGCMESVAHAVERLNRLADTPELTLLAGLFEAAGHELALVGGPVRDAFLGRGRTTSTSPRMPGPTRSCAIVTPLGRRALGHRARVRHHRRAQSRRDASRSPPTAATATTRTSRKPEVVFGTSLEDDLVRRDFTVNAMALRLPEHELVDPSGGIDDLLSGAAHAGPRPSESFGDDPLRMLRAARFAAQLGFDRRRRRASPP